jgi:hypothetical protein
MIITTPIMRTLLKTLLTSVVLVAALTACESPLDVDTPRIETPLTPAPKVIPRTIELSFETATGSYGFLGTPIIKVDTTVKPMRIWIDIDLQEETGSTTSLISQFRIKADSMAVNGLIESLPNGEAKIQMDVGNGLEWFDSDATTNTAAVLVAEHPREAGQPREVTITVYLVGNKDGFFIGIPTEQILGTIHLVI